MAASAATPYAPSVTAPTRSFHRGPSVRREITPQAGRALEILGHAIEYLSDELVHAHSLQFSWHGGSGPELLRADNPRVEAIQLLMALNREVYYACPVVPTFSERCRSFFRLRTA